jgi:hypothetical protein
MAERLLSEIDKAIKCGPRSIVTQTMVDKSVEASASVIGARLDGLEKAVQVFQADLTRVPTTVDRQTLALRELIENRLIGIEKDAIETRKAIEARENIVEKQIANAQAMSFGKVEELSSVTNEKFYGVAAQFAERDTRTDQRAGDTKLAVDAAFAAAKEATAKIEAGFTKQIDAMINIIDTKTANLAGGLGDIKDRMTAMENRTVGMVSANTSNREDRTDIRGMTFGIAGIVIGLSAIALSFMIHFIK